MDDHGGIALFKKQSPYFYDQLIKAVLLIIVLLANQLATNMSLIAIPTNWKQQAMCWMRFSDYKTMKEERLGRDDRWTKENITVDNRYVLWHC